MTKNNTPKLQYLYCDFEMGVLEKTEDGYQYTSNYKNEQYLLEARILFPHEYTLWGSRQRKSKMLFKEFDVILNRINKRKDIVELAEISPNDSRWERLVKLARLRFFPSGFYVQLLEEEKTIS